MHDCGGVLGNSGNECLVGEYFVCTSDLLIYHVFVILKSRCWFCIKFYILNLSVDFRAASIKLTDSALHLEVELSSKKVLRSVIF